MITKLLTYFLLFGLVFFVLPFSISPYEVPKVIVAILFISILSVSFFLNPYQAIKKIPRTKLILFILLVGIAFVNQILWGNILRPQGTITYLVLFLLFFIAHKLPLNLPMLSKLACITLPLLLLATLIIGPRESFRFIGPLGESNSLGATVLFLFPLTSRFTNRKYKYLGIFSAIFLVLMAGSRSVILAFFIEFIIIYFRNYRLLFFSSLTLAVFVLAFSFILPFLPHQTPSEYFLRFENRSEIWDVSFWAGFSSPIFGHGFGSMDEVIHNQAYKMTNFIQFQPVDSAHNLFLNWWIMVGGMGVLILITIIVSSFKNLYKQKSWILFSMLTGLLIVQLFNPVSIVTLVQFWWILGISLVKFGI